jgi:uncharacterized protein YbjQ (UPF0145 family)
MRASSHVTTTSSIDGWRVDSYQGVVASHVVAGTGFGQRFSSQFFRWLNGCVRATGMIGVMRGSAGAVLAGMGRII